MFRVSERVTCKVVCQQRSTQRHVSKVVDIKEIKLRRRFREIAAEHIRWGWRIAYPLCRGEGSAVNHKRVHRLWREDGLQRPTPRRQKRGLVLPTAPCGAIRPNTQGLLEVILSASPPLVSSPAA